MRIDRDPTLLTPPPVMTALADDDAREEVTLVDDARPRRLARGSLAPPVVRLPAQVLSIRTIDAPDDDWSPVEPVRFAEGTGAHAGPTSAARTLDRAAPYVVGALVAAAGALIALLAA